MLREVARMRENALGRNQPIRAAERRPGASNAEVVLCGSDSGWRDDARKEVDALRAAFGPEAEVHHIGSTAVEGVAAKPIVDLAIALPASAFEKTLLPSRRALDRLGYRYLGMRGGLFFEKGPAPIRTHALQIHIAGSALLVMLLGFRDLLRQNEEVRREYVATKAAIACSLPRHRWIYAIYKGHWIQEQQWRMLGATGWGDWFIVHRRARAELAEAARGSG